MDDLELANIIIRKLDGEVESLRRVSTDLEYANNCWIRESGDLRQQLAAKDSIICGLIESFDELARTVVGCKAKGKCNIAHWEIEAAGYPFLDLPTCPHKEEVEYQKKRVSELEEPMKCDHYGANLQPDDSNADVCVVCVEVADLQAELTSLREVAKVATVIAKYPGATGYADLVEVLSSHESLWPVKKDG